MSFDEVVRPHQSTRYEGEDTSPTSKPELQGWYAYAIAAEVFAVVAVGAFLPLLLEQLARERGVVFSDRTKPCVDHASQSGSAANASRLLSRADDDKKDQCVISFIGTEVTTASFAMYTTSAAVVVQAITLTCVSSFADYGSYRKKLILMFAYTGSIASALFVFVSPTIYFLAPILVVIGVTCLGCSNMLLNAFLPLLVSNYREERVDDMSSDFELEALNPESTTVRRHDPEKLARDLKRSAKLSSRCLGYSYIAAVSAELLAIGILVLFKDTSIAKRNPTLPMRIILLFVGLWWAIFTIPTFLYLRPRPGPPLPIKSQDYSHKQNNSMIFYTKFSLSNFWDTLKHAFCLRQVIIFLVAWFLLSDAIATITGTAVLFARTELRMGAIPIALLSITSIGSGILGAFLWPLIAIHFSLTPKSILLICSLALEIVPLYGLLGYLPILQKWGWGGLQRPWEIYPLGVVHGFIMGGIGSYARSMFGALIPPGREAAFFALYAITDKGSSAFGPALVGAIVDRAGTIRPAFAFLAVLSLCPAPLLWWLDVEKGREDVGFTTERRVMVHEEVDED